MQNERGTEKEEKSIEEKGGQSNLITPKELSKTYKLGINTVYRLTQIKGFPVIAIGRKKFIPRNLFEEWIKDNLGKCM